MSDRSRALPMSDSGPARARRASLPRWDADDRALGELAADRLHRPDQLVDDLVHPIALFHVPIQGAGTSIAELFELCGAQGAGSVGLDGYDWEYFAPLREGVEYRVDGSVTEVERTVSEQTGRIADRFVYAIEMTDPDGVLTARITNHWRIRR